MKTWNCLYENGYLYTKQYGLTNNDWWTKKIDAENPREAYDKFLVEVGLYPIKVIVETGFFRASKAFDEHIELAKKKNDQEIETAAKESFNDQISEVTKEQGLGKPENSKKLFV